MNRTRAGLVLVSAAVLLAAALFLPGTEASVTRETQQAETARPVLFSRLAFHTSQDGQAAFSFEARELGRRRARFGPLALNPFSELLVDDARIVIHVRPNEESSGATDAGGPLDAFELMLKAFPIGETIDLGTITRVSIRGFETRFVAEGNELVVEAREAQLEPRTRKIDLRGRVVLRAGGTNLRARGATWRLTSHSVEIHGPWELETGHGTRRGVDAKLAIRPERGVFDVVREGRGTAKSRPLASGSARLQAVAADLR